MGVSTYVLSDEAQAVQDRFEVPVLVAALAVIPVVLIEEQVTSGLWLNIASVANWMIWVVFLAEYFGGTQISWM